MRCPHSTRLSPRIRVPRRRCRAPRGRKGAPCGRTARATASADRIGSVSVGICGAADDVDDDSGGVVRVKSGRLSAARRSIVSFRVARAPLQPERRLHAASSAPLPPILRPPSRLVTCRVLSLQAMGDGGDNNRRASAKVSVLTSDVFASAAALQPARRRSSSPQPQQRV